MTAEIIQPTAAAASGSTSDQQAPSVRRTETATAATRHSPKLALRHRYFLQISDCVAVTASACLGALILTATHPSRAGALGLREVALVAVSMVIAMHVHGMYRRPAARLRPSEWWRPAAVARCLPTAALLALASDALLLHGRELTLTAAVTMTLPAVILVPAGRRLVVGKFDPVVTRILVVGTGPISDRLTSRLRRCPDTLVVGHVDDNVGPGANLLGGLADLPAVCAEHRIDRVIVSFPHSSDDVTIAALRQLQGDVPISEIPRYFELHNWRSEAEELHGLTLVHLPAASLSRSARVMKRVMDLTLASTALVLISPFMLVIALAIKLDSPGPVFFRQDRGGRGGHSFRIFKFRSMTTDSGALRDADPELSKLDGPMFIKKESDPRVTRVGSIIRKTSLDELPQLINVLRGEMSLVGPRPLPVEEADYVDGHGLARLKVRPGVTGLWQVCGRSDLTYQDLQHLDSVYVRSWSLMWDIRIMWKTPQVVLKRSGAY